MQSQAQTKQAAVLTSQRPRVTISYGDGIGREIMTATLQLLQAAGAELDYDEITIGEAIYRDGVKSGIPDSAWETLRQNRVFLKAPITTPQGGGYKSLNVTIRKTLGLFANVRPVRAFTPFVDSHFPKMDVVVIRENEEDLYAGIEHQQTPEVVQCLKLVSVPGCERLIRYAFEYARANGRRKVTCMTKDNIMKHTDGLFHQIFNRIAAEYPDLEHEHYIIDIGSALLAHQPERFDVVVTLNLYGDIISDITAQIAGSVGLGGSANVGENFAMFEAIHGSAPDIAGQDIANPSGLIHAACMMLQHVGQGETAARIQNALLRTLEDGIHTRDISSEAYTTRQVGTQAFTQAVIERLGQQPERLSAATYNPDAKRINLPTYEPLRQEKQLVGVDIFLDWTGTDRNPNVLGKELERLAGPHFQLKMITNRGVKVYPNGLPETFCTDHWRCRFVGIHAALNEKRDGMQSSQPVSYRAITDLLQRLTTAKLDFIKIENLYEIGGERAYSLGQGE
ncbi:MAG: NADP-dependent isocitrate dehydrogenase [Lewinella sp.]|nr:NADP-dependent isocitrate dehydrogenase [Lewinella sp.]